MGLGLSGYEKPEEPKKTSHARKLTYTGIALAVAGGVMYLVLTQPGCNSESDSSKLSYPIQIGDRS